MKSRVDQLSRMASRKGARNTAKLLTRSNRLSWSCPSLRKERDNHQDGLFRYNPVLAKGVQNNSAADRKASHRSQRHHLTELPTQMKKV